MTFNATLRRVGFAAGLALVAAVGPAYAQDAQGARLKLAREVLDVSGAANFDNIVPIFLDEAKRTFIPTHPNLSREFDEVIKVLLPEFEQRREQLVNEVASVYAERFTEAELTDIKTFYETPTGKKLVAILPGLIQAGYEKMSVWSQQLTREIPARMREEMRKKGHDI